MELVNVEYCSVVDDQIISGNVLVRTKFLDYATIPIDRLEGTMHYNQRVREVVFNAAEKEMIWSSKLVSRLFCLTFSRRRAEAMQQR